MQKLQEKLQELDKCLNSFFFKSQKKVAFEDMDVNDLNNLLDQSKTALKELKSSAPGDQSMLAVTMLTFLGAMASSTPAVLVVPLFFMVVALATTVKNNLEEQARLNQVIPEINSELDLKKGISFKS